MRLLHLRIACYLYNQFTNYDQSYSELSKKYQNLDPNKTEHVIALIKWLRSWGCRQFKKDNEDISIEGIMDWYRSKESRIPRRNVCLMDYDLDKNKKSIIDVFDTLSESKVAMKQQRGYKSDVHMGPVGTAKTLFALRPNLFSPWDKKIYESAEFKLKGNGSGYVEYLSKVKKELEEIRGSLKNTNINWNELFDYLQKEHKSYPKLIDEYYWVTITKGCDPLEIGSFLQ